MFREIKNGYMVNSTSLIVIRACGRGAQIIPNISVVAKKKKTTTTTKLAIKSVCENMSK
jgi:hypothetical protein